VNREVSFSFDTEEQKLEFTVYAAAHGLSLSAFAKWACYAAKTRSKKGAHHPPKNAGALVRPAPGGKKLAGQGGPNDPI